MVLNVTKANPFSNLSVFADEEVLVAGSSFMYTLDMSEGNFLNI